MSAQSGQIEGSWSKNDGSPADPTVVKQEPGQSVDDWRDSFWSQLEEDMLSQSLGTSSPISVCWQDSNGDPHQKDVPHAPPETKRQWGERTKECVEKFMEEDEPA